jgi:hypothetical protein
LARISALLLQLSFGLTPHCFWCWLCHQFAQSLRTSFSARIHYRPFMLVFFPSRLAGLWFDPHRQPAHTVGLRPTPGSVLLVWFTPSASQPIPIHRMRARLAVSFLLPFPSGLFVSHSLRIFRSGFSLSLLFYLFTMHMEVEDTV